MLAFYDFARQADDLADDASLDAVAKHAGLDRFERGLDGAADGAEAAVRLRRALAEHGRPSAAAHARRLLGAFRLDAKGVRLRAWEELLDYCRLSADPVGRFVLDVHDEGADAHGPADALCTALQILNHLQDLREDELRLGRVYLPLDWLESAGGREADLRASAATPGLRRAMDRALGETEGLLSRAARLPGRLRSRRLAAEVATILALADGLRRRLLREDPLARRVAPGRLDFARAALRGLAAGLRRSRRAEPIGGAA